MLLLLSVKVLKSLKSFNFDISKALENFTKLPQELISFEVNNPHKIIMNSEVRSEVSKLEKKLGNKGKSAYKTFWHRRSFKSHGGGLHKRTCRRPS